ncbi:MAG: hypothetical protein ACOZNI_27045 [Myxococcota bacterium]
MLPLFGDKPFDLPVRAALLYYREHFDAVFALSGRSALPAVRALGADALRKLHRYDEALAACAAIANTTDPAPANGWADASAPG